MTSASEWHSDVQSLRSPGMLRPILPWGLWAGSPGTGDPGVNLSPLLRALSGTLGWHLFKTFHFIDTVTSQATGQCRWIIKWLTQGIQIPILPQGEIIFCHLKNSQIFFLTITYTKLTCSEVFYELSFCQVQWFLPNNPEFSLRHASLRIIFVLLLIRVTIALDMH